MKILILDEAEQDLAHGFRFYEAQETGLGDYFLESLFSDISSLQLFAGIHAKYFGYHRLLAKRFPYAIYYRIENNTAGVIAVLDCRQDPRKTTGRLTTHPTKR